MKILLTGGLGYIGTNIFLALNQRGHEVIIFDNLSNSDISQVGRLSKFINKDVSFIKGDLTIPRDINEAFLKSNIEAVIHLAGLKSVSESISNPLKYYNCNVSGSVNLFLAMINHGVRRLIFSSSATVYGKPLKTPIMENHRLLPGSIYGSTKLVIENMIQASADFESIILRYFNPIGSNETFEFGEFINSVPSNIMPILNLVASGRNEYFEVLGNNYDTRDGSAIRDYIHVSDLANAHVSALDFTEKMQHGDTKIFNIGTGIGHTVKEIIRCFEEVNGVKIKSKISQPRAGDIDISIACPSKANDLMGWRAIKNLEEMCSSSYLFYKYNPKALG